MNKYQTLKKFLLAHKTTAQDTHTCMKGGKYNIPWEEYDEFVRLYTIELMANRSIHLTERHLPDHSMVLIDLDFRFPLGIDSRQLTNEKIEKILHFFVEKMRSCDVPENLCEAWGFVRENHYNYKDKYIKDGIHIMFPALSVDYEQQKQFRLAALNDLKVLLFLEFKWNLLNLIDDIYDIAVIDKNNWLMYGSSKPELESYKLQTISKISNGEIVDEHKTDTMPTEQFTDINTGIIYTIVQYLSIRRRMPKTILTIPAIPEKQTKKTKKTASKKNNQMNVIQTNSNEYDMHIDTSKLNNNEDYNIDNTVDNTIELTDYEIQAINKLIETMLIEFTNYKLNILKIKKRLINGYTYYFVSTNDKYCSIVCREHQRSSPTQYIYISNQGYQIRCYNQECSKMGTPATPKKIPYDIYSALYPNENESHNSYDNIITISSNKTLNNKENNSLILKDSPYDITETINNIIDSMRVKFPGNKLNIDGDYQEVISENSKNYLVPLSDKYNPIEKDERDDVVLSGQISKNGFNLLSLSGKTYGQIFPPVPIAIDPKYMNILYLNYTVNNTTINNIYNNVEDDSKLIEFEEDADIILAHEDSMINNLILKSLNSTHYDVAKLIFELTKTQYRCVNNTKSVWYCWKNHKWVYNNGGSILIQWMSEGLPFHYMKAKKLYEKQPTNKSNKINTDNKIKKIDELLKKLKTSSFKNSVMSECCTIFYNEYNMFLRQLDENPNLICFENGVMDLEKMEFRDGLSTDNISFCTNINYKQYTFGQNEGLETFLSQILPDIEKREYVLKLMSSALCGSVKDEKFYIWTGSGGNGKSKLIELFDKTLGDYSFKLPISLLTQKRQASNQASPELSSTKGKRFGTFQEPSENEKINVGLMKELTGGDKITCRGLFQDQMEFKPQFKLVLCCNSLPEIPSSDGGTWRRLRVIEFTSRFVEEPDPTKSNEFKADKELDNKLNSWKEDFMGLLVEYYKKYKTEGLKEPKEVMKYTNRYKDSSDELIEWFNNYYIITNNPDDYVSTQGMYDIYKNITGDTISLKTFSNQLKCKLKVDKTRKRVMECGFSNQQMCFIGVKPKDDDEVNE